MNTFKTLVETYKRAITFGSAMKVHDETLFNKRFESIMPKHEHKAFGVIINVLEIALIRAICDNDVDFDSFDIKFNQDAFLIDIKYVDNNGHHIEATAVCEYIPNIGVDVNGIINKEVVFDDRGRVQTDKTESSLDATSSGAAMMGMIARAVHSKDADEARAKARALFNASKGA